MYINEIFGVGEIHSSEIFEVIQVALSRRLVYIRKMKCLVLAEKSVIDLYVLMWKSIQDILSDKKQTV